MAEKLSECQGHYFVTSAGSSTYLGASSSSPTSSSLLDSPIRCHRSSAQTKTVSQSPLSSAPSFSFSLTPMPRAERSAAVHRLLHWTLPRTQQGRALRRLLPRRRHRHEWAQSLDQQMHRCPHRRLWAQLEVVAVCIRIALELR